MPWDFMGRNGNYWAEQATCCFWRGARTASRGGWLSIMSNCTASRPLHPLDIVVEICSRTFPEKPKSPPRSIEMSRPSGASATDIGVRFANQRMIHPKVIREQAQFSGFSPNFPVTEAARPMLSHLLNEKGPRGASLRGPLSVAKWFYAMPPAIRRAASWA